MTGHDSLLLVLLSLVASELDDLSTDVLKGRSQVDRSTPTNAIGEAASLHEAGNARDTELKSSLHTLAHADSCSRRVHCLHWRLIGDDDLSLSLSTFSVCQWCRGRSRDLGFGSWGNLGGTLGTRSI